MAPEPESADRGRSSPSPTPSGDAQQRHAAETSAKEPGQSKPVAGPAASASGLKTRAVRLSRARACEYDVVTTWTLGAQCKRHKIKCDVKRGETACARCLRTGLECVPYDPAQRLWEEDAVWKTQATANICQLQAAVNTLLQRGQLTDLTTFPSDPSQASNASPANSALGSVSVRNAAIVPIEMRREQSPEEEEQPDDPGLVPAPMRNLYELTRAMHHRGVGAAVPGRQPTTSIEEDIISQGLVSIDEADRLFMRFLSNHQPLLWGGILFHYRTLTAVRRASTLLSTAILTVAALHTPGCTETLQKCYDAYITLVSNSCLSRHHNLDDVRGLVVAAFYLPNLSWRLSGQAARMAAEMSIHHAFQKLINGDASQSQTERVRMWYALYVCDRHFSIAYGRPSAMSDDAAIQGVEQFIQMPTAEAGDMRLCAQVALFKILAEAFLEFGTDQSRALGEADLDRLRAYNMAIEQWRILWQPRSPDSAGIGSYPSCGVVLYYHFGRFQLNSLALRGMRWPPPPPSSCNGNDVTDETDMSINRREAVMTAISAAMSTLLFILREGDMRRAMTGVPLFTHTLVAFCATFLLKLTGMLLGQRGPHGSSSSSNGGGWRGDVVTQSLGFGFNVQEVLRLTRASADLLSEVSEMVSEKHLTRLVAAGIREALHKVEALDEGTAGGMQQGNGVAGSGGGAGTGAGGGEMDTDANVNGGGGGGGDMVPPAVMAAASAQHQGAQLFPGMDFTGQGHVGADGMEGMTYNMDMNDLVGMLENGFDETFLGPFGHEDFESWGGST